MEKFYKGVLNLHIESSLQIVLDEYMYKDSSICVFNEPQNKKFSYKSQYSVYGFTKTFEKVGFQNALRYQCDYLIILNLNLNQKQLELIGQAMNLDIGVILVNCQFDREALQLEMDSSEFFKIDRLKLKEKLEDF